MPSINNSGSPAEIQVSKVQIAVAYAKRLGWSIGPLLPDKKTPPFKDWWSKTTNDPDRLADFWSPEHKLIGETRSGRKVYSNPDYNIGLDTEKSGIICIDCDEKDGKHGIANLRKLAAEHGVELGPDADVFLARSASGGKHAYFEGDAVQSKNGVLADGVDVKSRKALAVLPGSTIHGKPYIPVGKLRKPRKPDRMPQWLIDAIAQKWTKTTPVASVATVPGDDPADIAAVKARLETEEQSIQGSGGNANLIRVIRTLWDAGITADTAVELLGPWNDRNSPPWDDGELEYKVHSAYQNPENAFGCRSLAVEFADLDADRDGELQLCRDLGLDVSAMIKTGVDNHKARQDAAKSAPRITATPFVWRDPATIPRRQWLFGNHYIRGFATGTIAPGGTGKTALTLTEALSMATWRDLIGGNQSPTPLKVWFWNLEDPAEEVERRIAAAVLHHGIDPATLYGQVFVNSGRDTPLVIARKVKDTIKVLEPVVDALVAEIRAKGIDVLIVDPFVSSHSLPENDNTAMDAAVKAWARVADQGNCSIELVHHSRKLGGEEASAESARGGSAFVDACRGVRVINRMSTEEAGKLGISEPRFFFSMMDDKPNMAPPPTSKRDWFQLVSVQLPNGDNVGAVDRWQKPNQLDNVTAEHLASVKALFAEGTYLVNEQSPDWGGRAVASVIGVDIGAGLSAKARTAEQNAARAKVRAILAVWLKTPGGIKIEQRKNAKRELKDCYAAADDE